MDRVMTVEERIRRAEEIYERKKRKENLGEKQKIYNKEENELRKACLEAVHDGLQEE